jgi:hypothetical protein
VLTQGALDALPDSADRAAALRQLAAEVTNISGYLRPRAGERYANAAAETLAPVAVSVGIDAATNGDVATIIEHVATYGSRLPPAGQTAFIRRAAEAIEVNDLAAAGWAERRLQTLVHSLRDTGHEAESVSLESNVTLSSFPRMNGRTI